ncbi:hypothetical protein BGZ58_004665 [Dissophora ornata]|nr:hypothetical protein BGZ58_004665 [Dissophora ornata]
MNPHQSKLSKQYTPSEEDSDEENDVKRRSRFLSGAALELNSNSADNLRALSRMSISQVPPRSVTPSLSGSADSGSIKSTKKKMSLGKRISRFFGGSKSSESASFSASTKSSSSSILGSEKSAQARSSTTSLTPIDELIAPPSRAHDVYLHQRSFSTPNQIGDIGSGVGGHTSSGTVYNAKVEEARLRKARDSGFEEAESNGHRRHSSSIAAPRGVPSRSSSPKLQQPHSQHSKPSNRSPVHKSSEAVYIDNHQHHHVQQARRSTYGNNPSLSTSSPQLRAHSDRELHLPTPSLPHSHRHSFMGAELAQSPSPLSLPAPSMPRRSSAPIAVPETLISKVDREKASVCFQAPSIKRDTFTKDANLDPVLSNMVQQHRKDFKTNQRLGGTPQPQSPMSHQGGGSSPRMRMSMHMDDHNLPPMMLARDPNARRDSSGSQHLYYINNSGLNSPQLPSLAHPPSPGIYASEAQMKRLSTSSQHQIQQQHPYFSSGQRASFSVSQGSLHQYPTQSQGQHSPRSGPQRLSPKHLSSAGHFTIQQQQQQQQQQQLYQFDPLPAPAQLLQVSPFSSPSLGAKVFSTSSVPSTPTELSLQLQQHQQLEQLQQIRFQQQQLLLQQQQQLQQQLQQTRVTAAGMQQQQQVGLGLGAGVISAPALMYTSIQQQQSKQQQMYMHPSTMMAATTYHQ